MRVLVALVVVAACTPSPDAIQVELAPRVISSLDGTTQISAIVSGAREPLAGEAVHVEIAYTDRTGATHVIDPIDGTTDHRGVFTGTVEGLRFDGTGTITVSSAASPSVTAAATFAVLDRTPPTITILPPTSDGKVGPGLPLTIQVHATDEIGIADVALDLGGLQGTVRTVAATGAADTTQVFRAQVPQNLATGDTIELHALAHDLSGNAVAAAAVTLTVDAAITIATPPGLTGTLVVDGTAQQLASPRAVAYSAKDGHLYVADVAQTGACQPSCIWRIDPGTGAIDATPVVVGKGVIEGLAFDATADNLYYADRQNNLGRLTYNGTAYAGATACVNAAQQRPQDPYHLVFDTTLGIVVVDGNAGELVRVATCAASTTGTLFTNANFDTPRGLTAGAAGEFYASDTGTSRIAKVAGDGTTTPFEATLDTPYGMRWLAGGTTAYADSLLVAAQGARMVASTKGNGGVGVAFLRNAPIDLTLAPGAIYVVTTPGGGGGGTRGRLYRVAGF